MSTLIKTLQATFVRPTAHKEAKLIELRDTYCEALHETFDADASTLSSVGEISSRRPPVSGEKLLSVRS